MRTVEASRFVGAPTEAVERVLTPRRIVEAEGSFSVRAVTEGDDEWLVTAGAGGLELMLRFRPVERGYEYEQLESGQPLEEMETTLTYDAEDEGTRLAATSSVSLGVPPAPITDRIAGWKRRGELHRALDELARAAE